MITRFRGCRIFLSMLLVIVARLGILNTAHNNDDELTAKVFLAASYLLLVATFPLSILLCLKVCARQCP